ncbi:MAG: ABC transporter ATP-binding protein [Granulosicoccus sp.]
MSSQALELSQVRKAYGDTKVIHGIDLAINEGEFIVFVGPSGCGKSTLLRLIAGLEQLSSGDIMMDGKIMNAIPASERNLAMVFQSYALYPHMSVYKNLSFGLENLRVDKTEIKRRVTNAATLLQIEDLLGRRPGQLSGGQRQRVAIGRAIVRQPRIFLFDEPLSNLDAELRVQMRAEISNLHFELGNTMIYVTHDQVEAMTMANRIVVLSKGKIEQFGEPLELYNRPANQFVAGFIGSPRMNFLQGQATTKNELSIDGLPPLQLLQALPEQLVNTRITLGIRPEAVLLAETHQQGLPAVANSVEQLGSESYLYCQLPAGQELTVHHVGQTRVARRESIELHFDMSRAHLFDDQGSVLRHD